MMENDKKANDTLENALGSLENRMRALYNLGYEAGLKVGREAAFDDILNHFKKSREERDEKIL